MGGRRIFIIGGTSGIAIEVARLYAADGSSVVLAGRNEERLSAVKADLLARGAKDVRLLVSDLDTLSCHQSLIRSAWESFGGLDVALLAYGSLGDKDWCFRDSLKATEILHSNLVAPVSWITELAVRFQAQGGGTIAAIGSVAGDRGRKSNYVYGAAKGGLERFLQGLRNRLFSSGVRVVTIKPGFVDTPMTADLKKGPLFASAQAVGAAIFSALEGRGVWGKADVLYVPWFWFFIMAIIKHIPEKLFKRLSI